MHLTRHTLFYVRHFIEGESLEEAVKWNHTNQITLWLVKPKTESYACMKLQLWNLQGSAVESQIIGIFENTYLFKAPSQSFFNWLTSSNWVFHMKISQ